MVICKTVPWITPGVGFRGPIVLLMCYMCLSLALSLFCLETHPLQLPLPLNSVIPLSMTSTKSFHTKPPSIPASCPTWVLHPHQRLPPRGYFQTLPGSGRDPLNWCHFKTEFVAGVRVVYSLFKSKTKLSPHLCSCQLVEISSDSLPP